MDVKIVPVAQFHDRMGLENFSSVEHFRFSFEITWCLIL